MLTGRSLLGCRSFNADSSDTDGIVDLSWLDIQWSVQGWMQDNLNVQPWYVVPQ